MGRYRATTRTSWAPSNTSLAAAGIGTPAAIVLAWLLSQFGIDMPDAVAVAAGALIAAGAGYLMPERKATSTSANDTK